MKTLILPSLALLLTLLVQDAAAGKCQAKADILFLMDASGSIRLSDFPKELDFAAKIVESFEVGPELTQFGALLFSSRVKNLFCLDTFSTNQEVQDALRATQFTGGQTRTGAALSYARKRVFKKGKCGHRQDVAKIIILITDGRSRSTRGTLRQATFLKNSGTIILAIGVGRKISMPELNGVASRPDLVFSVSDFNALAYLRETISAKSCEEGDGVCKVPLDLVLLLDISRGIGRDNYNVQLQFAQTLTSQFLIDPEHTLASVVLFAHRPYRLFCLNEYTDNNALYEAIANKARYFVGSTKTSKALEYVQTDVLTDSCGARADAAKVVILVTDGKANSRSDAQKEADNLSKKGVNLVTVAIGDEVDFDELEAMAGDPSRVFHSTSYVTLSEIQRIVSTASCSLAGNTQPGEGKPCTDECKFNLVCQGEPATCGCEEGYEYDPAVSGCVLLPNYQEECKEQCTSNLECQDRGNDPKQCGCAEGLEFDDEEEKCVPQETCHNQLDVAFLLDASSTIGSFNFNKMLDFAATITSHFDIGPNAIQFAVVVYADQASGAFCLDAHTTGPDLEQAIRAIQFVQGNARTDEALKYAREQVFVPGCGARVRVPRAAIVVSDGMSSNPAKTIEQADLLKQMGTKVIAVGVGVWASPLELTALASENQLLYDVYDYTILDAIAIEVSKTACDGAELPGFDDHCTDLCQSNMQCLDVGSYRCRCVEGYTYDVDDNACKKLPGEGEPCTGACSSNLVCQANVCVCEQGYVYDAVTRQCLIDNKCEAQLDLVFVLDSSVSVGNTNFQTELTWVKNLAGKFDIGQQKTLASLVTYSDEPAGHFCFGDNTDIASLGTAIGNVPYVYGLTQTGKALNYVRTSVLTDACGQRAGVTKVVIVITDGYSTFPDETLVEAQLLKEQGVRMLSVAVGVDVSDSELAAMASSDQNIFQVENYDQLETIREQLASATCQETEEDPGYTEFCTDQCKDSLVCTQQGEEKICLCPQGQVFEDAEGKCVPAPGPEEPCSTLCSSNLMCLPDSSGNTCQCEEDFSWNADTEVCEVDPGFQEPCSDQCRSNLVCEGEPGSKSCVCQDDQYFAPREDKCVPIPEKGEPCTALCAVGLECKEDTKVCDCPEGQQYKADTASCELIDDCSVPLDLLIILDSSSSVTADRFYNMERKFAQDLTQSFIIGPDATRVSLMTFNRRVRPQFCFNEHLTNQEVYDAIGKVKYSNGITLTHLALRYARTTSLTPECGARDNAAKVILVVTDGSSTDPELTAVESAEIQKLDLTVITIGIGRKLNKTELFTIASEPNLVFRVNTFSLLDVIKSKISATACTAPLLAPGYGETCEDQCRSNLVCENDAEAGANVCKCPPMTGYDTRNVVCF